MKLRFLKSALLLTAVFALIPPPAPSPAQENLLTFKGDLRIRHETIDQENTATRNMERIRARINMTARVENSVNLVFGLASGETNSPVTTNQTLTGGFSDKPLWIDLAYIDWTPGELRLTGGKMKNPFYAAGRSQLIWDVDLNPEGFGLSWTHPLAPLEIFANGGFFLIEERAATEDSYLAGGQAGFGFAGRAGGLRVGAGFYDFINTRGLPAFYDSTRSFGNSVDALNHYRYDYRIVEFFGEYRLTSLPFAPAAYFQYVENAAGDVPDNRGWQVGATLGGLGAPGTWAARWYYQRLERNAVIGAFTNSDIAGGGTGNKGHALGLDYQISRRTFAGLTGYFTRRGIDNGIPYNRYQADINVRF